MKINLTICEKSVADLANDPTLSSVKRKAMGANPYLRSSADLGEIIGMCDGQEAGGEYVFPLRIKAGWRKYFVLAGSTLHVDPQFRKSGLGMDLPELRWQKSPHGIALGAGLSQMALPVHQLLDYNVFLLPRYLMLWKSRAVVEMKLPGTVGKLVALPIDAAIFVYAVMLRIAASIKLRGYRVREVAPSDDTALSAVAKLIESDIHSYCEVHDQQWLKWHLTESFSDDGPANLSVIERGDEIVGFYLTKRRFHAQASHRGFKNVWLGSIIEWQAASGYEHKLPWFLLNAALSLHKAKMDAVELPTDDVRLQKFFRHLGWRQVGEGNFVIKAGTGSPLENDANIKVQANWRLRPAMGDNGLS